MLFLVVSSTGCYGCTELVIPGSTGYRGKRDKLSESYLLWTLTLAAFQGVG